MVQKEGVHAFGGQVPTSKTIDILTMDLRISQCVAASLDVSDHDVTGREFPGEVGERLRQVRVLRDVPCIGGELLILACTLGNKNKGYVPCKDAERHLNVGLGHFKCSVKGKNHEHSTHHDKPSLQQLGCLYASLR